MTDFFNGIVFLFEEILFIPLNKLRELELSNWWLTNTITWVMIAILFVLLFYWVGQLLKFDKQGEERTDVVSHSFFKE